ncbi:hypothetical protein [Morganella morganii]|uniref:tail fiber/spike domain-containing protein n=1 Tax=Morganella morganii TaxID=582 RepID=UPI000BFE993F|nr:hypothetical protein [Morganella morganii]EKU4288270.1 hypothetical protein [Morganella morganii]EKU4302375.1 hypothetical protein [Morganella morganii]EKU5662221.1 hypothetical protein [Morganella morganii]EKU5690219.1 hypothetical protein [Morganella morganii]EKY1475441.1 hypothetical protein [Morganella morganii]
MATIPTQNAVPSEAPRDLKFNSGKIDEFVTSLEHEYKDRFGRCHMTIEGMKWMFDQLVLRFKVDMNQAIISAGYITVDSFQQGAQLPDNEITQRNQILRDETTGEYYRWDGDLPKVVPAGSTPESTGGIGKGAWIDIGGANLRTDLKADNGFTFVGGLTENYLRVFDNVAEMVAETSLPLGATVKTRGYYTINDGGEAEYTVTNAAANGIIDIALSNGLTASMLTYGDVDIRTVGAVRDTDIGSILVSMQDISRIKTVVIPGYSFDCNKKINVKKNFLFKSGAQIINRTLRDDMFVFETDNLFFKSEKIGGGRIAVDTPLKAWNHNVALVLGKNNLRNLNIDGVRLIPNYSDRSGTALKIRCNNVMDGTNDPARKQNSICWCHFDNLNLEEGEYTLVIEVYEPTDAFEYKVVTNWITACTFKNLVIKGNYGPVLKCIPKTSGKYAYYTQIANLEIDYIQQWTDTSIWALMIDGAGANNITSYIWDYSYYGNQGQYLVDVKGADGRDNRIETNLKPSEINFNGFSNIYIPKNTSQEVNAVGLRRLCHIFKKDGSFIINRSYYLPMGIKSVMVSESDSFALVVEYEKGIGSWAPYIFTQSYNQSNGFKYTLIPFYNQSPSSSGKAFFYIINNSSQELVRPSDMPNGCEFGIEIICTQ